MKEHPLRQVYLDQIGSLDGNDMTIVDVNDVSGVRMIGDLLAVLTGENFGALTEPRTDSRERVAIGGREIEFATNDSMRHRRKRDAGLRCAGSGRRRLCV